MGSGSPNRGRVEVYYNGEWGTVCDDGWTYADAIVVCRQLGFYSAVRAYKSPHYGQGTGPIWLSKLNCIGNESSLTDCNQSKAGTKNCTHSNDASMICHNYYGHYIYNYDYYHDYDAIRRKYSF